MRITTNGFMFFEIPLKNNLPEIKDFEIADGRIFTVAKEVLIDETVLLGHGNGDGIANPGESIVLLVKDQNKYWRTDLYFSDQFVNPFRALISGSPMTGPILIMSELQRNIIFH